ncbi:MAG TPA: polysaccharide deacetylase family protein [Saprospiraceae bacterium]|nr:polysaccharide deacetylase family protein [Saprospiraceae bacterium]
MRIAIVTSEIGVNSGGLSYSCCTYAQLLSELGYDITIISSVYDKTKFTHNPKYKVIYNEVMLCEGGYKKELKEHLFFRGHLKNILSNCKNQHFEFIIAFGAGLNGLFASEISRLTGTKLIVLLRGSEINLSISDTTLYQYNYNCLKQAVAIVSLSNELQEVSKAIYFNRSKIYTVIPNWTECSETIRIPNLKKGNFLLGCGAKNLNEKKGVSNLITMLYYLNQKSDAVFYFEFAGNVDKDLLLNYKRYCQEIGIEDNIVFLGDLSREDFLKKLKTWDFYVQGSFCEGFSNSIGDCLKYGIPIIISNSGFIAETICNEVNEIVFNDFVPEKMSEKIIQLLQNKEIKKTYEKAFQAVSSLSNVDVVKKQWLMLFDRIRTARNEISLSINSIHSIVLHDISDSINSHLDTSIENFESVVNLIHQKGYMLCSANDYFRSEDKSKLIICTFDDAYEGVYKYAFPVLKTFGFTATVFVCTDYFGQHNDWNFKDTVKRRHLTISELEEIKQNGWEIGSHGKSHKSFLRLSESELVDEICTSKAILEKHFGIVESFAYPYGDYNDYTMKIVSKNYSFAFSLSKGGTMNKIDNHQIRRYFISELNKILEL